MEALRPTGITVAVTLTLVANVSAAERVLHKGCGTETEQTHICADVPNGNARFDKFLDHVVEHWVHARHGQPVAQPRLWGDVYRQTTKPGGESTTKHDSSTHALYRSAKTHVRGFPVFLRFKLVKLYTCFYRYNVFLS
jgi:hypothetical protein